jgi:hypothetical protein
MSLSIAEDVVAAAAGAEARASASASAIVVSVAPASRARIYPCSTPGGKMMRLSRFAEASRRKRRSATRRSAWSAGEPGAAR